MATLFGMIAVGYLIVGWRAWRNTEAPVILNQQDQAFIQEGLRIQRSIPSEGSAGVAEVTPTKVKPRGPLDLNRADSLALLELPGIGPTKVKALLAWRRSHGRFSRVEDLLKVKGIGPATFKRLRDQVRVVDEGARARESRATPQAPTANP